MYLAQVFWTHYHNRLILYTTHLVSLVSSCLLVLMDKTVAATEHRQLRQCCGVDGGGDDTYNDGVSGANNVRVHYDGWTLTTTTRWL